MQNISFLSLTILSLISKSPFYSIDHQSNRQNTFIYNSRFLRSFSNKIFSNTEYHSTAIKNNIFKKFLQTPIKFSNLDNIEGKCGENSQCCVSSNYSFEINKTIQYLSISNESFPDSFEDKRLFFREGCGDITILDCQFLYCYSINGTGGAISILQDCEVILHMCIFDHCISRKHGGACAIAQRILIDSMGPMNEMTQLLDVQYNCYQDCYLLNDEGYGSVLLVGAINSSIIYSTTSNSYHDYERLSKGAPYDLCGDIINTKYVNCTGGNSIYCGGIEYRRTKDANFMFNTFYKIMGKYILAFEVNDIESNISYCNIFNNMIDSRSPDSVSYPPAFIIYQSRDITIQSFFFCKNSYGENGRIAAYLDLYSDSYSYGITFIDCFGLLDDDYKYNFEYINLIDCHFDNITVHTIALEHINTGNCKNLMTPSDYFSSSFQFTPSYNFDKTSPFTPTFTFSPSGQFTQSSVFTPSYNFDKTSPFTPIFPF